MYSNTTNKRTREESGLQTPRKAQFGVVKIDNDVFEEVKNLQFKILMPDGSTLDLKMRESRDVIPVEDFIDSVRKEYLIALKQGSREPRKKINWKYQDLHFTDVNSKKISIHFYLVDFKCDTWHFLRLHDGSPAPSIYEDMWDLTPDTELLTELPNDYTFETALADLIDNSLQAVWSNNPSYTKLISVELHADRIGIFDSGPGMEGTDGNLAKWGKMGASLHRSVRANAIGGEPPYLVPFFGMFGYGGPVAAMCLGRRAVLSSKTRKCKQVFTLHLEREALISASHLENCWRTKGGMRDPSSYEKKSSPNGSFTKVEIYDLKMKAISEKHILFKLKDIYFPYIQCDEISGRTSTPVKFQVNGKNLAEIPGGEVAITNMQSCNGPNFIIQLRFRIKDQCKGVSLEAHARLKLVYFPIIGGKESIDSILKKLNDDGYGSGESFVTFSRVSVRRLGRLLPDARWASLPFMEPRQKVGEKAKILKRCSSRVKCFIDTDAGFNPTLHKSDLVQHHPYTKALKNFGSRVLENDEEVQIGISNDGKDVTLSHLEKLYFGWVSDMHDKYDEETDGGLDEPTLIVCNSSSRIEKLGLPSLVFRVHKEIQRKGQHWRAGQKIRVLKGACPGVHKNHVYATLEYVVLDGLQGDSCGEARLVCRPLGLPDDKGCKIINDEMGSKTIEIGESLVFPIRVIDSEQLIPVDCTEWENKLNAHRQRLPSAIELLCDRDCQELEIEGGMIANQVEAGDAPPENIAAVIRPKTFNSENNFNRLNQKFISKYNDVDMSLEVNLRSDVERTRKHLYSLRVAPLVHKGLKGLYIFPLRSKIPEFQEAGYYTFSFSLAKFRDVHFEQECYVQASATSCSWSVVSDKQVPCIVRVGSTFDSPSIACSDKYGNNVKFASIRNLNVKVGSHSVILAQFHTAKLVLSADKSSMMIKGIVIKSDKLDNIRPDYEATICISTPNEAFSVAFPCLVLPGTPHRINVLSENLSEQLIPGQIINYLALGVYDEYGNHAKEDENIMFSVDGFSFEDRSGVFDDGVKCLKKVDSEGIVDLSNILRVSHGYGKNVYLSVSYKEKVLLKLNFRTETRKLQTTSKVFKNCKAGSSLEDIVFEIVDSEGTVDESIHHDDKSGHSHTLQIESDALDIDDSVQYTFRRGRCTIRYIPLPRAEGIFSFSAAHSRYRELHTDVEVHVVRCGSPCDTVADEDSMHSFTSAHNSFTSAHNSCEDSLLVPNTPISKALKSPMHFPTPLTLTGTAHPTTAVFSPRTPVHARHSAKLPRENAMHSGQFSKSLGENSERARHSPITLEENSVHANRSLETLRKSGVPASCEPNSPKMLKVNSIPAGRSPKTLGKSAVPPSFSPRSPKVLKGNSLPARQSPKMLEGNSVTASQSPKILEKNAVPPSFSSKTSKEDAVTAINSLIQVASYPGKEDLYASAFTKKDLEDYFLKNYMEMSELKRRLNRLELRLNDLQCVSNLQGDNESSPFGKALVQEKIKSKSQSAGAITCKLIGETSSGSRPHGIFGVVALLGAVETIQLSRILAQYLGDDLMRAVVCESSGAAKSFEMEHGNSVRGGYYTLCLEDISPVNCEPSSTPQDTLSFSLPTNPNGCPPKGFLGYAVNMINMERSFLQWRTSAGHGLRQTLFYRLFGKLQVYKERSEMINAESHIEDGAISLDGGITRGNGLLSSGHWEPDVIFPVLGEHDVEVLNLEQEIDAVKKLIDIQQRKYSEAHERLKSIQSEK